MKIKFIKNLLNHKKNNYEIIKDKFKEKKYEIKKQLKYIDKNGKIYKVDGKHVILKVTKREKEVAHILGKLYGGQIKIIPRVNEPSNIKTPDYIVDNKRFDLKQIKGKGKYVIEGNIRGKKEQAYNFIIDLTKAKLNKKNAYKQIDSLYNSNRYLWVEIIILIKKENILRIYKRK